MRLTGQLCPPMTYKEKYKVVFIEKGLQMYGCASLDHNRKISRAPLLHLWLEVPIDSSAEPTYCKDTSEMVSHTFECMSKTEPTNKEEIDKGLKYMSLYQYPTQYIQIPIANIPSYRCVAFVTEEYKDHGIMVIRMALSHNRENSYDKTQCKGLSNMLLNKDTIYDVEKQNKWPEGASYIFMTGDLPLEKSITQ
ncbi:unnamed protein product [Aphis gossypii]|uniref:Uncharacterized protein n=1 Tax=Aphis gossypii TaxID=80765 RepID=A0A9P0J4U3_APHGO|nr:unnamed protein product [Aphis gossypii]